MKIILSIVLLFFFSINVHSDDEKRLTHKERITVLESKVKKQEVQIKTLIESIQKLANIVEQQKSNSSLKFELKIIPVGVVTAFAGEADTLPSNWMLCDGSWLDCKEFDKLYEVLGKAHGYQAIAKKEFFALPDYQGYFLRGVSHNSKVDPDADRRKEAKKGGNKGNKVGSIQGDQPGPHLHTINDLGHEHGVNDPGHEHLHGPLEEWRKDIGNGSKITRFTGRNNYTSRTKTSISIVKSKSNISIRSNKTKETRPTNAYVNWIIKVK
ncbi:phage tail protein [Candidatus Uabimicrobium amorphum]|uniref:Phage tail collar domain-containing protein n=1 Tax=Uabimicrobium amorphum TaxID=2596890 RepID=A0A5S9IN92_UABAM|nr:tail fiber protein [Candidatus Uabimicrobium amorphum]BBM84556.1 hypothetical protein UABAM_02917 [Candidatus Uabimicrobium amorphum]